MATLGHAVFILTAMMGIYIVFARGFCLRQAGYYLMLIFSAIFIYYGYFYWLESQFFMAIQNPVFSINLPRVICSVLMVAFLIISGYRVYQYKLHKICYVFIVPLSVLTLSPLYYCHEGWGIHCHYLFTAFHLH